MWTLSKPKVRHLLALVIFVPLLLLTLYFVTINSDDYEEALRFVSEDARVANSIGRVSRADFKFWSGFDSGGGIAHYSFEAATETGVFGIKVRLKKISGSWRVEAADIHARDGTVKRIAVI
ncbi:hypothetical protein [Ramlibacter rhizophilus]|uniref:Uncharacterized protein n=1 Tax=Ramlibacter rhizophilus TaxID=1781167 RepID=A0A4Z0BKU6_9BURK|nr:hypothetical protein [Ramlibacter rhizophilus]TFY98724.1 hypothetical protein EZ242_14500 [Ramlibacter rhizophilus]